MISFIITCDNLFQGETFDAAIIANGGSVPPKIFRHLTLKNKQSFRFDFDSVDWQWCDGDSFVILGTNNSIKQKWPLSIQKYAVGECPECHGTKKCYTCSGRGFVSLTNHRIERCDRCHGSGQCQTCYVPERTFQSYSNINTPNESNTANAYNNQRRKEMIQRNISELQNKIHNLEWDIRMMELKGMNTANQSVYSSNNALLYRYQKSLIEQQSLLDQLENL